EIPCRKDAGNRRQAVLPGGDKARFVHRHPQRPGQPALWQQTHRLEQRRDRQVGDFSHSGVPQGQAGEAFRSLQGLHHGGPQQREVGGLLRPLHQNGIRPEVRPPVDHRHMAADVCQIQRILQGG
ncbi:hypothetical protein BCGKFG_BCGKFG_11745, partial [Dysosmobacter welbionis]